MTAQQQMPSILSQPSVSGGNASQPGNNGTMASSAQPVPPQKDLTGLKNKRRAHFWHGAMFWAKAYEGSLFLTSIGFPIFASAVTVSFYLAPHFPIPILGLDHVNSSWYAPIYGFLTSCLALLLFAAFRLRLATARGANMNVYELLKNSHSELKARLGLTDISDHVPMRSSSDEKQGTNNKLHKILPQVPKSRRYPDEKQDTNNIQYPFDVKPDDEGYYYRMEALRKAYEAYDDLTHILSHNHSGIEWAFGTGYTNAWRTVHRAQEALIGVETDQQMISDVIHDVRSIQRSPFSDGTALIRKLLQAVKDINPEAMAYFEELQSDKNYADLFDPPHQHASAMELLVDFFHQKKKPMPTVSSNLMAREAVRQVRHTVNLYQDHLRETLVRLRNHVWISIAVTGFVTYFLVCNVILWNAPASAISTATVYYLIGVMGGLFLRFYNESNNKDSPEDYGLFVSRLIATPLLSGLAGIGGILVTATVSTLGANGSTLSLDTIFMYPPNLDYLVAATIFGSTPNLIIGALQQRAQRYTTELQTSKGEATSKGE